MRRIFSAYALAILGSYGYASWTGWEMGSAKRGFIPASVRQSPGGYRSYHYWGGGK